MKIKTTGATSTWPPVHPQPLDVKDPISSSETPDPYPTDVLNVG